MYYKNTWFIIGLSCLAFNCLFGYLHCMNNFCPGDSESDYVYEYEDGDGNKFITDGVSVPKDTYIEVRRYEENAK